MLLCDTYSKVMLYLGDNLLELVLDFIIGKAKNRQALILQVALPDVIVFVYGFLLVNRTICFNNKLEVMAVKDKNVVEIGVLPSELVADWFCSQITPEHLLCIGWLFS